MTVEIAFPVEFIVEGVPVSLAAKRAQTREKWKMRVARAARAVLQEGHWATLEPVAVTIFYFPRTILAGDLDNIVKPILDALCAVIYVDDRQIERIVVQKFEPTRLIPFSDPTAALAEAVEGIEPLVYIRVDSDTSRGL